MKKIVVFVKTINTMDGIVPLLFQLYKQELIKEPLIIAWDGKSLDFLNRNIVLRDAVYHMGGEIIGINKGNIRWLNQIHNVWILRKILGFSGVFLETYPGLNKVTLFVLWLNRVFGMNNVRVRSDLMNRPQRFARNTTAYYEVVRNDYSTKTLFFYGYDYLLLSHDVDIYEDISRAKLMTDATVINIGYTRGLPSWIAYIDRISSKYLDKEINEPYFFFPLSSVSSGWLKGEDNISMKEKFIESLRILRNYNDRILTVFKPHHKTDVKVLRGILNEVNYRNYIISYLHPKVLIQKANFTFAYHPTSILIDAFYEGCPTVEYGNYDSRFYEFNKHQPRYLDAIDFFSYKNAKEMNLILDKVVLERVKVVRDKEKMLEDFPVLNEISLESKLHFLG